MKILIIDDQMQGLEPLAEWLADEGNDVTLEDESDLLLETVCQLQPDIIFLDICMPRRNGLRIAKEIKGCSKANEIPLIAHSCLDFGDDNLSDFDDVLFKGGHWEFYAAMLHKWG